MTRMNLIGLISFPTINGTAEWKLKLFPRWKQKFQTFAQCAILVYFIYGGNVWRLQRREPDNNFSFRSHSLPRRKIFQFSIQPEDWMDDSRKVRIKAYYTPLNVSWK